MFYEEESLSDLLNCQQCNHRLDEPKVLPCGATICLLCTDRLRLIDDLFQCQICSNNHYLPREGLPTSSIIQSMLLLKPIEILRTKSVNSLKTTLKNLQNKLDRFKSDLNNGKDRIQEYCIDLRTELYLCTELLIERINKLSDELLKEINDYEKECISNFENKDKKEFVEMIQKVEEFYSKWNNDVNRFEICDQTFNDANQNGLKIMTQIEDEISKLDDFIFDGNRLKFVRKSNKIESDFLGSLITEKASVQSDILSAQQCKDLMKICNFSQTSKWKRLYRASSDGFSAASFYSKCEGMKNTLTIIKSVNGNIFGGYTEVPWTQMGGYKSDLNAFLFSLVNKDNESLTMKCNEPHRAIQLSSQHLVVFGGCDLLISSDSNSNSESYSNLGYYYSHPHYEIGSDEAKSFLAGSFKFQTIDIEVFCKE